MRVHALCSMLAPIVLSAAAHGSQLEMLADSGIYGPPYREIAAQLEALASTHVGWASTHDYGESLGGQPLRAIRIESPAAGGATPRPAVLISGATHGNEYLNIADRLPAWFLEQRDSSPGLRRYLEAGGAIYVIPILNPDGYDRRSRYNHNGTDLNRDFDLIPTREPFFREPETRTLAEWLEQEISTRNLTLKVTVDYHCCDGSLLFPWAYSSRSLPSDALAAHTRIARLMNQIIDSRYRFGATGQVLGYYPRGTSKDYYFAKYGALAFTFEGAYRREHLNFDKHTVWWDRILGSLVSDGKTTLDRGEAE